MNKGENETSYADDGERDMMRQEIGDRQALIGLLALIGLALPALLIRYLFPNLNPVVLAGLGVAAYATYLGLLLTSVSQQIDKEAVLVPVAVKVESE